LQGGLTMEGNRMTARRRLGWLLAVAGVALSSLVAGSSPASADLRVTGQCWTPAVNFADAITCLFGNELGPRGDDRLRLAWRDDPVPDGACAILQVKAPGELIPRISTQDCSQVPEWRNIDVSVRHFAFFGKVDVRLCATPPRDVCTLWTQLQT
jgi:hypothetical protein